jgi:flavin-dependent dehydrogenase
MQYDAIISGGSFAGLAAAVQLHGKRVLLVEPHTIGAVQTSACGTLLAVLEAIRTMDSLLQVHDRILVHLGQRTFDYPMPYSFCTFDYRVFCNCLLAQSDVEILRGSVLGHDGHKVSTARGVIEAGILIEAQAGARRWQRIHGSKRNHMVGEVSGWRRPFRLLRMACTSFWMSRMNARGKTNSCIQMTSILQFMMNSINL